MQYYCITIHATVVSIRLYLIVTMKYYFVEIKCQLDATEVFIADLIACSTCFGHHYAHQLRVMCPVCRML